MCSNQLLACKIHNNFTLRNKITWKFVDLLISISLNGEKQSTPSRTSPDLAQYLFNRSVIGGSTLLHLHQQGDLMSTCMSLKSFKSRHMGIHLGDTRNGTKVGTSAQFRLLYFHHV